MSNLDELREIAITELKVRMLHDTGFKGMFAEHHAEMIWERLESKLSHHLERETLKARIDELYIFPVGENEKIRRLYIKERMEKFKSQLTTNKSKEK